MPSNDTTAGTRVSAAITVRATAIARPGPCDFSDPNDEKVSELNAMTMAAPAEVITLPTWATAVANASLGVVAGAQPFSIAEEEEENVVGADTEEHHGDPDEDRLVGLEVEQLLCGADQAQ